MKKASVMDAFFSHDIIELDVFNPGRSVQRDIMMMCFMIGFLWRCRHIRTPSSTVDNTIIAI